MWRSLSLCSGIGGLDLALRRWVQPQAFCEIDTFCQAILRARFPGVPVIDDIRTLRDPIYEPLDLVVAGFPCQPFSTASRGRRTATNLWPEVLRIVSQSQPGWVFLENVQRDPIYRAAQDLSSRGYQGAVAQVCASQVGAPHDRPRWWLLAHTDYAKQPDFSVDAEVARLSASAGSWDALPGGLLDVVNGVPDRMARLRALGNAVVPACAELAFAILLQELTCSPSA